MSTQPSVLTELPVPLVPRLTARRAALGGLIALTALPFLAGGTGKALGAAMFATGFPAMNYPLWFMHLLGVLELSGAIGLVFRRTRVLAVAGLASILFGAVATHIVSGQGVASATAPAVLILLLGGILALDSGIRFELGASPSRARRIGAMVLGVLLALAFLPAAAMKIAGAPELMQELTAMRYSVSFIHVLGGLELLGAVGLLVPRVRALAAFGLAAILHGAVASHVVHGGGTSMIAGVLGLIAVLYVLVAVDGRFTVRVDGVPAWRRFIGG